MGFQRSRGGWTLAVAAVAVVAAVGGTALAQGGSSDPSRDAAPAEADDSAENGDAAISDDQALAKASQAALEHTGGGEVTEIEVGDEESHYEVEVTLEDGRQVDVQLNEQFEVVGEESDDEESAADDRDD